MANAILQSLAGIATQFVLMKLLLPEDFGRYALIAAEIGLVQMALSLRTPYLIIRSSSEALTLTRRGQYLSVLLIETLVVAVVAGGWLWLRNALDLYAAALLLSLIGSQFVAGGIAFTERSLAYRQIAAGEAVSLLSGCAAAVATAAAGAPLAALYGREAVVLVVRVIVFARLGIFRFAAPRWLDWHQWRSILREGRDLWAEGLFEGGFARLVSIGVAATAGQQGLGYFTQSQRLATLPHMVLQPLVSRVAGTLFARLDDRASRYRAFLRLCLGIGLVLSLAALVGLSLADPLIPWLFGDKWAAAVPVLYALAGVVLFTSLFEAGRAYCLMRRMARVVFAARAVQYAVMVVGSAFALDGTEPTLVLAASLSLAMALSFVTILFGIWRADRPG